MELCMIWWLFLNSIVLVFRACWDCTYSILVTPATSTQGEIYSE